MLSRHLLILLNWLYCLLFMSNEKGKKLRNFSELHWFTEGGRRWQKDFLVVSCLQLFSVHGKVVRCKRRWQFYRSKCTNKPTVQVFHHYQLFLHDLMIFIIPLLTIYMNRESRTLPIINGVCFPEEHYVCGQDLGCGSSCLNTTKSTKTLFYTVQNQQARNRSFFLISI